jgi:hypothetical protein
LLIPDFGTECRLEAILTTEHAQQSCSRLNPLSMILNTAENHSGRKTD